MRILMLGNSYTRANNLPEQLGRTLDAQVVAHTRGGARLAEQLNPNTKMGARTQAALAQGGWDFVILQEMSNGPATAPERYRESVAALCIQVRRTGAIPILFATWAYAPGAARLDKLEMDAEELHRRLHASFVRTADETGALLADVGSAFHDDTDPDRLYAPDGSHPSPAGTALACRILAATVRQAAGLLPSA
ncbi:MAG: SGNH/GDSL hydrolase family protein [Eggerthellaceae bacterium]|jgi:lysophospholipase L1-like esterase